MNSGSEILRRQLWLLPVFGLFLLPVSCVEEMELPEGFYQERLVINSVLDPDSLVRVNVSRSMTPNGKISFDFIEEAVVGLGLSGEEDFGNFQYDELGWYENPLMKVDTMSDYFLQVSSPGLLPAQAYCQVPVKPRIADVRLHGDTISLRIVDAPDEDNFYLVRTYAWHEVYVSYEKEDGTWDGYLDTIYELKRAESDLEFIEAWYGNDCGWVNSLTGFTFDDKFWNMDPDYIADSYVFSDRMFNGQTIDFHMDISYGLDWVVGDPPVIDLFIHALDENYYSYLITLAQYLTTDETPFTERARVHNNIEDGFGVFGAQNGLRYSVSINEQ